MTLRHKIILVLLVFGAVSAGWIQPLFVRPAQASETVPGVVVKTSSETSIEKIASKYKLKIERKIQKRNEFLLRIPSQADLGMLITQIAAEPDVESVEPNALVWTHRGPHLFPGGDAVVLGSDPDVFHSQPLTAFLQMPALHCISTGKGVTVAVIDTGVDASHPTLAGRLSEKGYDFVDDDSVPNDVAGGSSWGHGTFIAGLVALTAPEAEILPIRALGADGTGDAFRVAAAIYHAADEGADIINLSLGTDKDAQILRRAVQYAQKKECLVVAALGNDDLRVMDVFPASLQNVVAVASTDFNDQKATFSNHGPLTSLCAPGVNLIGPYPEGRYATWCGTSFAAPLVSAEAALLLARESSVSKVVSAMNNSATCLENSRYQLGRGRIDPLAALGRLK